MNAKADPKPRILVVEDEKHIAEGIRLNLSLLGYAVTIAGDGVAALQLWKTWRPDLIVLDVLMPRESGIRLYRKLKTNKKYKDVPIVMLSGIAEKSFLRSQKALTEFSGEPVPEPDVYLEKPVEAHELAEAIKKILG